MKIGKIIAILLGIAFALLLIIAFVHEFNRGSAKPSYYQEDVDAAYEQGYEDGGKSAALDITDAYDDGYEDGYRDGFDEGAEVGYGDGYEDAKNGW